MIRSQCKILHFPKSELGWESEGNDITSAIDFQSSHSTQVSADTFQLTLKDDDSLPEIGYDDRIDFFAANTPDSAEIGTTSEDYEKYFVFNGTVEETKSDYGDDGERRLIITGASATQVILRMLFPAGFFSQTKINVDNAYVDPTVPNIIKYLLQFINESNPTGRQIVWSSDNPIKKSNDDDFPAITYATNYKPVYQIISDLSTSRYTDDGDYYFYIKVNPSGENELIWKKINPYDPAEKTLSEGVDFSVRKVPYGVWDVTNFVIVHCGRDAYNQGIMTYYYSSTIARKTSIGQRAKYISENIAGQVLAKEAMQSGKEGIFTKEGNFPTSYNYYTLTSIPLDAKKVMGNVWENQKFLGEIPFVNFIDSGDGTPAPSSDLRMIISNNYQFNFFLRGVARLIGKFKGKEVVEKYGNVRYKFECNLYYGRNTDTLGGIYSIVSPSMGWTSTSPKNLRLVDIKHTFGADGWNTSLSFEEDWTVAK